jgi:hypothetical protein
MDIMLVSQLASLIAVVISYIVCRSVLVRAQQKSAMRAILSIAAGLGSGVAMWTLIIIPALISRFGIAGTLSFFAG